MLCTEAYREHIKDLTEHLAMSWVLGDNGDTKGVQGTRHPPDLYLRAFYSYAAMRDTSLVVYQSTLFQIPFKKTEKVETVDYLSRGALKIRDVRLGDTPQVKLQGKGNKSRSVPLMKDTVSHYYKYMQAFHPGEPGHSRKPLFYTIRKNVCSPIFDDTIRAFMNGYAKTAHMAYPEVPERVHPYIFRHSRAMHLYQQRIYAYNEKPYPEFLAENLE